jgi:hypothetical protein
MAAPLHSVAVDVFADYFQFYLWDKVAAPDAPTEWTDQDVATHLKADKHVVVVCPARNMKVAVVLEVHAAEPAYNPANWDHIAECSLELPSGQLELHECTGGSRANLPLAPGTYRVRAFLGSLDSLSPDGLRGDDHYRVVLWPAPFGPVKVLKQWQGDHHGG